MNTKTKSSTIWSHFYLYEINFLIGPWPIFGYGYPGIAELTKRATSTKSIQHHRSIRRFENLHHIVSQYRNFEALLRFSAQHVAYRLFVTQRGMWRGCRVIYLLQMKMSHCHNYVELNMAMHNVASSTYHHRKILFRVLQFVAVLVWHLLVRKI